MILKNPLAGVSIVDSGQRTAGPRRRGRRDFQGLRSG